VFAHAPIVYWGPAGKQGPRTRAHARVADPVRFRMVGQRGLTLRARLPTRRGVLVRRLARRAAMW
jgi:hypothetical protein